MRLRGFNVDERKSGGLHEKHAVATWNLSICLKSELWDIHSARAACSSCPHRSARHTQQLLWSRRSRLPGLQNLRTYTPPNFFVRGVTRNIQCGQRSLIRKFTCLVICVNFIENVLVTYLLTPLSTVLLEKPIGFQLVKKFPAFYGTRRFITAFTSAHHLSQY